MLLLSVAAPVSAKPQGDARDPDVGKKLWNFNVIATPNGTWVEDDTVCGNNGNRIFFSDSNGGTIRWALDPAAQHDFDITDCDGTSDRTAGVTANESISFWVMIKLVGPKTSTLNVVCQDVIDYQDALNGGVDDLCVVDSVNLQRNASTKIIKNIAESQYEEVLWTLNGDWKIFQVLVYEKI